MNLDAVAMRTSTVAMSTLTPFETFQACLPPCIIQTGIEDLIRNGLSLQSVSRPVRDFAGQIPRLTSELVKPRHTEQGNPATFPMLHSELHAKTSVNLSIGNTCDLRSSVRRNRS